MSYFYRVEQVAPALRSYVQYESERALRSYFLSDLRRQPLDPILSIAVAILFILHTNTSSNFHPGGPFTKTAIFFLALQLITQKPEICTCIYADMHRFETYESEV